MHGETKASLHPLHPDKAYWHANGVARLGPWLAKPKAATGTAATTIQQWTQWARSSICWRMTRMHIR